MMAKVSVKGSDITPLYAFLTDKSANPKTGGEIGWNFTKFLIGPDGKVIARFDSEIEPDSLGRPDFGGREGGLSNLK